MADKNKKVLKITYDKEGHWYWIEYKEWKALREFYYGK